MGISDSNSEFQTFSFKTLRKKEARKSRHVYLRSDREGEGEVPEPCMQIGGINDGITI